LLVASVLACVLIPTRLLASAESPSPRDTSFAYVASHPVAPLPDAVVARVVSSEAPGLRQDESNKPVLDIPPSAPRLSRAGVCNAVVSVARANGLPVPFFANLIWQESGFNSRVVSPAGAQGIAQFMPKTAVEYGLTNPFEPIHALHAAAKFLRRLQEQFGNLGLAAAAYNAGPGRVSAWVAKRRGLPEETRNYVVRITGRPAAQWTSRKFAQAPEAKLMPAKAPCVAVAEEVAAQAEAARATKLAALAQARAAQPRKLQRASGTVQTALKPVKARAAIALAAAKQRAPAPVKLVGRVLPDQSAGGASAVSQTTGKTSVNKTSVNKTAVDKASSNKTTIAKVASKSAPASTTKRTRVAAAR
jgi:hypothetical protein